MGFLKYAIAVGVLILLCNQQIRSPSNHFPPRQFHFEPATKYPCVCPGLRRPVCVEFEYGVGYWGLYDNLCSADCRTFGYGSIHTFPILPRFFCRSGSPPFYNYSVDEYHKLLLEDIQKEAAVYKQANSILYKLLDLSSIPGASPCTCPGIRRPVYMYGSTGDIMRFENVCHLKCFAMAKKRVAGVFPSLEMLVRNGTYQMIVGESDEERESRQLSEWITGMETEIKFYEEFHAAFNGLFPTDK